MDENRENNIGTEDTEETADKRNDGFMPDGYAEGDDFFDMASWSGAKEDNPEPAKADDFRLEDLLTNGDDKSAGNQPDNSDAAPTTGGDEVKPEQPRKLKFQSTYNHKTEDVEMDESELPALHQKAKAFEQTRSKLDAIKPIYDEAEVMAKSMGYGSLKEMLEETNRSYREAEIKHLTDEGVHPDMAADFVDRKMKGKAVQTTEKPSDGKAGVQESAPQRDFAAEVQDTLKRFPETKGKQLPDEVIKAAVDKGVSIADAYAKYKENQHTTEIEALKRENNILKQNADAAARSPVSGVTRGGRTDTKPSDPFLAGFNADKW